MKVRKTGQVTFFLIFGVLLVMIVTAYVSSVRTSKNGLSPVPSTISVKSFVDGCVDKVGADAVDFVGSKGGYYELPEYAGAVPYYYFANTNLAPSRSEIESQIDLYMESNLQQCLNGFEDFAKIGLNIHRGILSSSTTLLEEGVDIKIDFPLEIRQGNSLQTVSDFSGHVENVRLKLLSDMAREITDDQIGFASICASCIVDLAQEHDVYVEAQRHEDELIFTIIDPHSRNYQFSFGGKYDPINCESIPFYLAAKEKTRLISQCLDTELRQVPQ